MELFERNIREMLVIDETSPSGLRWGKGMVTQFRGKIAGSLNHGYWRIGVSANGRTKIFQAHRIVWFIANGTWPKEHIDHANLDRADNRLINLREASWFDNNRNRGIQKNNSSGVKGVNFHKVTGKWEARIPHNGKRISLGLFADIADAERAVRAAREKSHGEFANHGTLKAE